MFGRPQRASKTCILLLTLFATQENNIPTVECGVLGIKVAGYLKLVKLTTRTLP